MLLISSKAILTAKLETVKCYEYWKNHLTLFNDDSSVRQLVFSVESPLEHTYKVGRPMCSYS